MGKGALLVAAPSGAGLAGAKTKLTCSRFLRGVDGRPGRPGNLQLMSCPSPRAIGSVGQGAWPRCDAPIRPRSSSHPSGKGSSGRRAIRVQPRQAENVRGVVAKSICPDVTPRSRTILRAEPRFVRRFGPFSEASLYSCARFLVRMIRFGDVGFHDRGPNRPFDLDPARQCPGITRSSLGRLAVLRTRTRMLVSSWD